MMGPIKLVKMLYDKTFCGGQRFHINMLCVRLAISTKDNSDLHAFWPISYVKKEKKNNTRGGYEIRGPVELKISGLWTRKSTSAQAPKKKSLWRGRSNGDWEPQIQVKRRVKTCSSPKEEEGTKMPLPNPQIGNPHSLSLIHHAYKEETNSKAHPHYKEKK